MKIYEVTTRWHFKNRYEVGNQSRVRASNVRAAVGKALAQPKKGWREMPGRVLHISVTVVGGLNNGDDNREGG